MPSAGRRAALQGVPGVEASLPRGRPRAAGPESLGCVLCALTKPRAVCTWPRCPGCGAGRGSGGTFPGGEPRSPRLQPPPRGRAGPRPRPRAGQGAAAIAAPTPYTVARGSARRWVRGIGRPISGPGPGAGAPAGTESSPEAGCREGPALLSRLGLSLALFPTPYQQLFAAPSGTQVLGP